MASFILRPHTPEHKRRPVVQRARNKRSKFRPFLLTTCSRCGFQAQCFAQIELDHIDGEPMNDTLDNLQELCANCHKLKHHAPVLFATYPRRLPQPGNALTVEAIHAAACRIAIHFPPANPPMALDPSTRP